MTYFVRFVPYLYAALLRFYPYSFRYQFAEEMLGVFAEAVKEATRRGWLALAIVCFRELSGLPVNLFREHKRSLSKSEHLMSTTIANDGSLGSGTTSPTAWRDTGSETPGSWKNSLLAGLPHFVLALVIGSSLLATPDLLSPALQRWTTVLTGIGVVCLLAILVIGLLKARRKGWPLWSASWYLYVIVPVIMLPLGFLQQWNSRLSRAAQLDGAFLFIAVPLLLGYCFYRLLRRDRFMALLAVLPLVALLWMPVLEFVPSPMRTWLTMAAWLLVGLTAACSVRLGAAGTAIWLALGMNLLIGLPYAYAQTYLKVVREDMPNRLIDAPVMMDFINTFAPQFLGVATLILGSGLIWKLRCIGKQAGGAGIWGYRLAAVGFSLMVVGNLAAFWWMMRTWPGVDYLIYQVIVYGGMLVYLIGSGLLLVVTTKRARLPATASSVLLTLSLLGLPLVLMLPLLLGMRSMPRTMPFAFLHIHDFRLAAYGLGFVWLLLAGWLASRPTQPTKRDPKPPPGVLVAALAGVLPILVFSLSPDLRENNL